MVAASCASAGDATDLAAIDSAATETPTSASRAQNTLPTPSISEPSIREPLVAESPATESPPATEIPTATPEPGAHECTFVEGPPAPLGETPLQVDVIANGLEVPWGLALLPDGDMLVTERPGRLRLIADGQLVGEPVLVVDVSIPPPLFGVDTLVSEGGLLGVLLHPDFEQNRLFYLFSNANKEGAEISRIDRFVLADDARSAAFERNIIDDLPAGVHHQGGRMHLGPDGLLYVGVGAWEPERAQDLDDLSGKLLRMGLDGETPTVFASGVRNTQGFDWFDGEHVVMVDHGPSGLELNLPDLRGRDEINVVRAGENLGWPRVWGCDTAPGLVQPVVSFDVSVPPTGATIYRGDLFAEWKNSLLMTSVGGAAGRSSGRHLQRVEFADGDPYTVVSREVYLPDEFGRLRTVVEAPDGSLYVMTSNCDDRGVCPSVGDRILRITPA